MKADFNIHGLNLRLSATHPLLFDCIAKDLELFRTRKRGSARNMIRLTLTALPLNGNGSPYPAPFLPFREIGAHPESEAGTHVTCYGKSAITVISQIRRPVIDAAVLPEAAILTDPAYHSCFTQPAGIWFKKRGLFFLHAGCVTDGPNGILIVGHSRAGKSTLSLSAVRGGFKFLSDEQPILSRSRGRLKMLHFPRRVRVDRSVARLFPELRERARKSKEKRLLFQIEDVWPGCLTESCEPRLLVFPIFRAGASLKATPLSATEVLSTLLQDDHFAWYPQKPWNRLSKEHLSLLKDLAQRPTFRVTYDARHILEMPVLFRRLLRHG